MELLLEDEQGESKASTPPQKRHKKGQGETFPCSIHGKMRAPHALQDDNNGGLCCKEADQCHTGGFSGSRQLVMCSLHGKQRSQGNMEPDEVGGWRCKVGEECHAGNKDLHGNKVLRACSMHGKSRSLMSLQDDGMGG